MIRRRRADSAPQPATESGNSPTDLLTNAVPRALVGIPQLFTVDEAAAYLRVHPSTVVRSIRSNQLGCVRIGRRMLIRADQLKVYVDRQTKEEGAWGEESSSTKNTGCIAEMTLPTGMSTGVDREQDAWNAAARALRTSKRRADS